MISVNNQLCFQCGVLDEKEVLSKSFFGGEGGGYCLLLSV